MSQWRWVWNSKLYVTQAQQLWVVNREFLLSFLVLDWENPTLLKTTRPLPILRWPLKRAPWLCRESTGLMSLGRMGISLRGWALVVFPPTLYCRFLWRVERMAEYELLSWATECSVPHAEADVNHWKWTVMVIWVCVRVCAHTCGRCTGLNLPLIYRMNGSRTYGVILYFCLNQSFPLFDYCIRCEPTVSFVPYTWLK